jgi:hypothetical protein
MKRFHVGAIIALLLNHSCTCRDVASKIHGLAAAIGASPERVALAERRHAGTLNTPAIIALGIGRASHASIGHATPEAIAEIALGHGTVSTEPALGAHALPSQTQSALSPALRIGGAETTAPRNRANVDETTTAIKHGLDRCPVELAGVCGVALQHGLPSAVAGLRDEQWDQKIKHAQIFVPHVHFELTYLQQNQSVAHVQKPFVQVPVRLTHCSRS